MKLSIPVEHGVTLNVRHRPGRDGRPFLLLHGLGSNARMWDEVADRLAAAGHPAYALDMRGHGESDVPHHGYDNTTVVADLVTVCRELRLTGVLLAGHSWGANIAVRVAAEHPGLAAGLALVEGGWINLDGTSDGGPTWEKSAEALERWHSQVTGVTEEFMREVLRSLHPNWSDVAVEANLADLVKGPDGLLSPRLPREYHLLYGHNMWHDPPTRWYPAITVPVLLLVAPPPYIPALEAWARKWVAEAEEAIPQIDARWYTGADHNLHADQPEQVAADLLELARSADRSALERS